MPQRALESALCLCLSPLLIAQQSSTVPADTARLSPAAGAVKAAITLPRKTEVELLLMERVSSTTAKQGQPVEFVVAKDPIVNGTVVIARGSPAKGTVKKVRKAIPGKRNGFVVIEPTNVLLADNSRLSLKKYVDNSDGELCDGFGSCVGITALLIAAAVPLWIISAAKAVFERHPSQESGMDETVPPCWRFWDSTTKKNHIDTSILARTQSSLPLIDIASVCPAGRTTSP